VPLPPPVSRPPALFTRANSDSSDDVGYGSDDTEDGANGNNDGPAGAGGGRMPDPSSIADAFATLGAMLVSDFDDVSAPAAQSIASLSVSRRVRGALGAKAAACTAAHPTPAALRAVAAAPKMAALGWQPPSPQGQQGQQGQASPTSWPAADASASVVQLFEMLLSRLERGFRNPYTNVFVPTVGIECRTSCAIAIANLVREPACAGAFTVLGATSRILEAVKHVPHGAATAAFRRESMRAVHALITGNEAAARWAAQYGDGVRARSLAEAFGGLDGAFDGFVRGVLGRLEALGYHTGGAPLSPSSSSTSSAAAAHGGGGTPTAGQQHVAARGVGAPGSH
jgi:hypothetical protein